MHICLDRLSRDALFWRIVLQTGTATSQEDWDEF
jgi:hypothetical protein